MRKIYIMLSVILGLYSCTSDIDTVDSEMESIELSSKDDSDNVKLLSAWTANRSSPVQINYQRKFKVKVKNLAYQKEVAIHHQTNDGNWLDIPLSYEQSIGDDEEIWVGEVTPDYEIFNTDFVVKYTVNGEIYWDNNKGENYSMLVNAGGYLSPDKSVEVNKSFTRFAGTSFAINVNAKRDYGATGTVEVVYTTDSWVTKNTVPLTYQRYFRVGYAHYIMSPNQFDVDIYSTSIRVSEEVQAIEFAVIYKVNGQEYWDNNYGNNYTLNKVNY
ncbi:Carbohydrate/starch-binding module (family 21) [Aquimarina amphilecti]|uniref:Carbohydrate/starch-binding module (Family 21) n=1 Tax=Aquimarina amphilecti TaxID=1038014 RepID=A0A1H7NGY4_AQUAM|nr:carbohydrate-binding protein [Aquimarina amphilecti]SEL22167.1 Carbohydrate/starch-binding module (family 21) [Aquimarina amphilecti]